MSVEMLVRSELRLVSHLLVIKPCSWAARKQMGTSQDFRYLPLLERVKPANLLAAAKCKGVRETQLQL